MEHFPIYKELSNQIKSHRMRAFVVFFFAIIASFLCVQRTAIHTYNWIECSESGLTSIESLMVAPIGQASILWKYALHYHDSR